MLEEAKNNSCEKLEDINKVGINGLKKCPYYLATVGGKYLLDLAVMPRQVNTIFKYDNNNINIVNRTGIPDTKLGLMWIERNKIDYIIESNIDAVVFFDNDKYIMPSKFPIGFNCLVEQGFEYSPDMIVGLFNLHSNFEDEYLSQFNSTETVVRLEWSALKYDKYTNEYNNYNNNKLRSGISKQTISQYYKEYDLFDNYFDSYDGEEIEARLAYKYLFPPQKNETNISGTYLEFLEFIKYKELFTKVSGAEIVNCDTPGVYQHKIKLDFFDYDTPTITTSFETDYNIYVAANYYDNEVTDIINSVSYNLNEDNILVFQVKKAKGLLKNYFGWIKPSAYIKINDLNDLTSINNDFSVIADYASNIVEIILSSENSKILFQNDMLSDFTLFLFDSAIVEFAIRTNTNLRTLINKGNFNKNQYKTLIEIPSNAGAFPKNRTILPLMFFLKKLAFSTSPTFLT
ncbi:hypothetical protein MHK_008722 [Candidatus Magnetomorum sp. HK-1]|nr:hypothetical protein MHK_008722 [Candidatus Magnetomorum sp. HK-1]